MGTLTDEDLRHLLDEAAGAFTLPEGGTDAVLGEAAKAEVVPLRRRRWVQVPAAAAVVAGAVLAGTLLAGGLPSQPDAASDETTAQGDTSGPVSEGDFDEQAGGAPGGTAAVTDSSLSDLAPAAAAPAPQSAARQAASAAAAQPGAAPPPAAPVPDGARVVKTGAIALIVEDDQVTPTLTQVQGFAAAVGGVVATAASQEFGPTPSGSVTLRVPVDSFEEVVAQVRGVDAEVRSATTSGQDVTAQYADLEAQLRTLTAARERFLEILSNARSIGDVLAVQQRVDDVTGQIDRLEGQRRVLAAQSDSATLEVTVTEADDPAVAEVKKPDDGLSKAFSDAWDGFTSGIEGLIRISGRGILLLMCAALAYVVLRVAWRASRRRLV